MSASNDLRATYVTHMGDDLMVVNAARVSFAKHREGLIDAKDVGLINYLAKNRHSPNTPNLSLIHISEPTRPY